MINTLKKLITKTLNENTKKTQYKKVLKQTKKEIKAKKVNLPIN